MPDHAHSREPQLDLNTKLSVERTRGSYDRTLMSWIRTATSLISFGFAIYKFFQIELQSGDRQGDRLLGPREFALVMVGAGVLAMALGIVDHWSNMRSLRERAPGLPKSRTFSFATVIFGVSILALLAVVFRQ